MNALFTTATLIIFFEWVLRFWFLLYVPKKRAPSSAIAWLLVVFLLPELGILLFFLIGSPKLSKGRMRKQKYVDGLIDDVVTKTPERKNHLGDEEKARFSPIIDLSQALGKLPLSLGNTANILPDPVPDLFWLYFVFISYISPVFHAITCLCGK